MTHVEHQIYGPPGTGKTTTAAKNIAAAAEKYGSNAVMVCSFTRAAATEIIQRDVPVDRHMIGTLHSLCFRALSDPKLAETKIGEFNEENPAYKLSGRSVDPEEGLGEEGGAEQTSADGMLAELNLLRARMVPRDLWPERIQGFAHRWEGWKREAELVDFTDLIEIGWQDIDVAPGAPQVGFIDEAQDLSALQFALVRKWAAHMERVIFIGDDDQSIYTFSGADPRHMIDADVPAENRIVLSQSYRVPAAVHAVADTFIRRCTHRQAKEYLPRTDKETGVTVEGAVLRPGGTGSWRAPERLVDAMERDMADGRSVMALATCGYMLAPLVKELRQRGILFHNPYRVTRGDWNPVKLGPNSTASKVISFLKNDGLSPAWTWQDLRNWTSLIKADGILRRGAKKEIEERYKSGALGVVDRDTLRGLLENGPWSGFDPWGDIPTLSTWLSQNAVAAKARSVSYVCNVLKRNPDQIMRHREAPRVLVGTVHSVKGGEADAVYLFPDLSREAAASWDRGGATRDAVRRCLYVGMTRAREKLVIPQPASPLFVKM